MAFEIILYHPQFSSRRNRWNLSRYLDFIGRICQQANRINLFSLQRDHHRKTQSKAWEVQHIRNEWCGEPSSISPHFCGFEDIEDWPSRLSYIIPSFPVGGIDGTSVDIWTLLEEYVNRPIESTCSVCRGTITGKLRVKPGKFSIFGINRLEYENQKVIQNNVLITNNPVQGQPLILW